jgi:hypothetical protein
MRNKIKILKSIFIIFVFLLNIILLLSWTPLRLVNAIDIIGKRFECFEISNCSFSNCRSKGSGYWCQKGASPCGKDLCCHWVEE